ncbi:hypothetical protein [Archangium lipolyticum]|uniref:hypothetical protein n=1 Tax=Archangium lipolyticum TaxID=2970465 RepID=UPI00214A42B6|nr:hypothetical protein [Archangium lipolyticum]
MARRYEAHHGTPLDLTAKDYERCIEDLEVALRSGGIRVRVVIPDDPVPSRESAPSPTATAPRGLPLGWRAVAIAVAFLLGVLVGRWSG